MDVGLSGTSRLHDLFVNIEGMTPGTYKNGGENLNICYTFQPTLFGNVCIASTGKGVCYLAFTEDLTLGLKELKDMFPKAKLEEGMDEFQEDALLFFKGEYDRLKSDKTSFKRNGIPVKGLGSAFENSSGKPDNLW